MIEIYFNSHSPDPWNKLSNFHPCMFIYMGEMYISAEHAYQTAKCVIPSERVKIKNATIPIIAKKLGQEVKVREDWNERKEAVMLEILRCKFYQNADLRKLLISTEEAILIHKAPWDSFWGDGKDGTGLNTLGKQLMQIRDIFLEKFKQPGIIELKLKGNEYGS